MFDFNVAESIVNKYINKIILPSDPLAPAWNCENKVFRKIPKWNYIDQCIIRSLLMLHEITGENKYIDYSVIFMNTYIDSQGNIPTMNIEDFNLDNICGGRNLLYLYRQTGDIRYRNAMDKLLFQLEKQPRLRCGNFWHKGIYPYQIWLDGVYMAMPFMTEYAIYSGDKSMLDDIYIQLENIYNIMYDECTGLYFHGYDETRSQIWADKKTGLSPEFWLRSMGWLSAGLADICGIIPPDDKLSVLCASMLEGLLDALEGCADESGMLYQLPKKPAAPGNYPETSGTLLYAYSAVKSGRESGIRAFNTITNKYIESKDIPILNNICLMAGLGGKINRDGSESYYLSERIVSNDAKGIAPYLMAYTAILRHKSK